MTTNRAFKLDVGIMTNQDARYIRLIKYEEDEQTGKARSFVGRIEWEEFQRSEVIEPTLVVTGLDHFRVTVEQ